MPVRCVVIYDGKFKLNKGLPSSFNMHYEGYLSRYLEVFDRVTLISRLYDEEDKTAKPVVGEGSDFVPLPHFSNEVNFFLNIPRFLFLFWRELNSEEDVVLLRIPSLVGIFAALVCKIKGIPYAVEVAGDPAADFSSGTAGRQGLKNRVLRPLQKAAYVWPMRFLCRTAKVSAYVTESTLQKDYPPRKNGFSTHYTTLNLPESSLVKTPRLRQSFEKKPLTLVNIGMMQRLIKGQDLLICAVQHLIEVGHDLRLVFVGAGNQRPLIESLVEEAGLAGITTFTGLLPSGDAVFEVLDGADIFVMPSRQEGLPRAMLEAMARGIPCVGSDVGGVPELLSADFVVPSNDGDALARKLKEIIIQPDVLATASVENLEKVKAYTLQNVQKRRHACYTCLKELKRS